MSIIKKIATGALVNWSASKGGYKSQSGSFVMPDNTYRFRVVLEPIGDDIIAMINDPWYCRILGVQNRVIRLNDLPEIPPVQGEHDVVFGDSHTMHEVVGGINPTTDAELFINDNIYEGWSMLRHIIGFDSLKKLHMVLNGDPKEFEYCFALSGGVPKLEDVIFEGALNSTFRVPSEKLTTDSAKSILQAASNTTNPDSKYLYIKKLYYDKVKDYNEIMDLIGQCTDKNWSISINTQNSNKGYFEWESPAVIALDIDGNSFPVSQGYGYISKDEYNASNPAVKFTFSPMATRSINILQIGFSYFKGVPEMFYWMNVTFPKEKRIDINGGSLYWAFYGGQIYHDSLGDGSNKFYTRITNVTSLEYAFRGCSNLDFNRNSSISITNRMNLDRTFSGCTNLTWLPIRDFTNVSNAYLTFSGCTSLTDIDTLKGFGDSFDYEDGDDVDFSDCPLSEQSMHNIVETIGMGGDNYDRLAIYFKQSCLDYLDFNELYQLTVVKKWNVRGK